MISPERPQNLDNVHMVNLLKADEIGLYTLKSQVEKHSGKIQVMVHPYYQRRGDESAFAPSFKPSQEFTILRDQFLKACIEHDIPLIIFDFLSPEEWNPPNRIREVDDKLMLRLNKLTNSRGVVYFVETLPHSPEPKFYKGWEKLAEILHKIKVKHIVTGGLLLNLSTIEKKWFFVNFPSLSCKYMEAKDAKQEIYSCAEQISLQRGCNVEDLKAFRWLNKSFIPQGCVGTASIAFLEQGFDVTLSGVSASEVPHANYANWYTRK